MTLPALHSVNAWAVTRTSMSCNTRNSPVLIGGLVTGPQLSTYCRLFYVIICLKGSFRMVKH